MPELATKMDGSPVSSALILPEGGGVAYRDSDNGPWRPYNPADTDHVPLDGFAWPGGYSVLYVAEDGAYFCAAHAWEEIVERDTPMFRSQYDEGPPEQCEGDMSIPHFVISSYGDPDAEGFGVSDLDNNRFPEWYAALHARQMEHVS